MKSHEILDSNLIFNMMPLKSKQNVKLVQQLLMKQIENSMQLCMSIFMPNQGSLRWENTKYKQIQNKQFEIASSKIELDQKQIFMELEAKFSQLKNIMHKLNTVLNQPKPQYVQEKLYIQDKKLEKQQQYFLSYILSQVGLTCYQSIKQNSFIQLVQKAKQKYQRINSKQYLKRLQIKPHGTHLQSFYLDKSFQQISLSSNRSLQNIKNKLEFTNESDLKIEKSQKGPRDKLVSSQSIIDVRGYTSIKVQNPSQGNLPDAERQVKKIIKNWQQNLRLQE